MMKPLLDDTMSSAHTPVVIRSHVPCELGRTFLVRSHTVRKVTIKHDMVHVKKKVVTVSKCHLSRSLDDPFLKT